MSKERLEEIKPIIDFQIDNNSHYGQPAQVTLNSTDVKWLIEQAEQNIEGEGGFFGRLAAKKIKENKRYREGILKATNKAVHRYGDSTINKMYEILNEALEGDPK